MSHAHALWVLIIRRDPGRDRLPTDVDELRALAKYAATLYRRKCRELDGYLPDRHRTDIPRRAPRPISADDKRRLAVIRQAVQCGSGYRLLDPEPQLAVQRGRGLRLTHALVSMTTRLEILIVAVSIPMIMWVWPM